MPPSASGSNHVGVAWGNAEALGKIKTRCPVVPELPQRAHVIIRELGMPMMFAAQVLVLFGLSGPPAVTWFIVPVVVYAIYGVVWRWALPHIRQECGEIVPPLFADSDAAPAVPLVSRVLGILASRDHTAPRTVLSSPRPAVRPQPFSAKAPAGTDWGLAEQETAGTHYLIPAVAAAQPQSLPVSSCTYATQRNETPNPTACQVFRLPHT